MVGRSWDAGGGVAEGSWDARPCGQGVARNEARRGRWLENGDWRQVCRLEPPDLLTVLVGPTFKLMI